MACARVRRDIWALETEAEPWDETTLWYARAVAEMKRRSAANPADPTGWTFQAAIHGTTATPGNDDEAKAWNQCQHSSWYFGPWHRMYLYYFERIIRQIVADQGGPDDWALPYWNYSRGGDTAKLPPAFRAPQWTAPDGSTAANPLYVAERNTGGININQGDPLTKFDDPNRPEESVVAYQGIFNYPNYFTPAGGIGSSFGGAVSAPTQFDSGTGELERQPHNIVHTTVGGSGWMSDPFLAALDPIFWLHHSNIDRLWELWLADGTRHNPTEASWRDQTFTLFDEKGGQAVISVAQVLDTAADLGYTYGDQPVPAGLTARAAAATPGAPRPGDGERAAGARSPQLVAANENRIELTGATAATEIPLPAPVATAMSAARVSGAEAGGEAAPEPEAAPSRFYLSLEGLQAQERIGEAYRVYLKPTPDSGDEHFVGTLTFFGAQPHGQRAQGAGHPAGTLTHTYDITELVGRMDASGGWDKDRVAVVLHPVGASTRATARGTQPSHPPATIGRVSIYQH